MDKNLTSKNLPKKNLPKELSQHVSPDYLDIRTEDSVVRNQLCGQWDLRYSFYISYLIILLSTNITNIQKFTQMFGRC